MTVDQKGMSPTLPLSQMPETPTLTHHTRWISGIVRGLVQLFFSDNSSSEPLPIDPLSRPEAYFQAVYGTTPHTCGRSAVDEPLTQHFR